jgi:hypothetical protein
MRDMDCHRHERAPVGPSTYVTRRDGSPPAAGRTAANENGVSGNGECGYEPVENGVTMR